MRLSLAVGGAAGRSNNSTRVDPYDNRDSFEFKLRARRFAHVRRMIEQTIAERGHAHIVDLGGTETYWLIADEFLRANSRRLRITFVNMDEEPIEQKGIFDLIVGDATDPALLPDRSFDLVHSNSVIEHVGGWDDFQRFAANVRRLAPRYYVQTPNYWFPFEPHFRVPGFQYLPKSVRRAMITRRAWGYMPRAKSPEEARETIDHHRLLSAREMRRLFPDARILREKLAGLSKSLIAIRDKA